MKTGILIFSIIVFSGISSIDSKYKIKDDSNIFGQIKGLTNLLVEKKSEYPKQKF